jgi:hypothetical protein
MSNDGLTEQERNWGALYDRIAEVLLQFGEEDHFGKADYLIVDDNYGSRRHTIEIHKLHMLRPSVVVMLQGLLQAFPDWEIVVAVDIPGTEGIWPRMGLTIRDREIIDDLQRQFLPTEFQGVAYAGSQRGEGRD